MAAVPIVVLLALLGLDAAPSSPRGGDSAELVRGARHAVECLGHGELLRCGYPGPPGGPTTEVLPYPMLQYLPAGALVALGLDDGAVLGGLVALSWMAFAASVLLVAAAGRRLPGAVGPLLTAIVLLSPLLFYAVSPFGEMLAAAALLGAVVAALFRRPWLTATAVALACLGKENLFPFVVVLALVAARGDGDRWLPPRRMTQAVLGGAAAGLVLTGLFNIFRFGSPRNLVYLRDELRTDGLGNAVSFFGAVWAGPAGGLAWFWPAAVLGLVAVTAAAVAMAVGGRRRWADAAGPVAAVGAVVAFTVGLGWWFSPFGWIAWGTRLALPLVPAALVAGAWAARDRTGPWAAALLRPLPAAVLVAVGLAAMAWPHLGVPWTQGRAIAAMIEPGPGCPSVPELRVQSRPDQYYRCIRQAMWRTQPSTLAAASRGGGWPAGAARAAGAAAAMGLVSLARSSGAGRQRALVGTGRSLAQ